MEVTTSSKVFKFIASILCSGVSAVNNLFNEQRNRLPIVNGSDLRLLLTKSETTITIIVAAHLAHPNDL